MMRLTWIAAALLLALPLVVAACDTADDDDDDDTVEECPAAESPTVDIVQPSGGGTFSVGDEVTFSASVGDDVDGPSDLDIHWFDTNQSDAEPEKVEFSAPSPDASGVIQFAKSDFDAGIHVIDLEVTDTGGCTTVDSVGLSFE